MAEPPERADAALLIGDPAIQASWRGSDMTVIDLGKLWQSWTGLGMTFALFAVRRETAKAHPEAVAEVLRVLTASKLRSRLEPQPLIDKACAQLGGTNEYWDGYFRQLGYSFGTAEQEGLSLYFRYAIKLGLLDREVRMQFFADHTALKVNE